VTPCSKEMHFWKIFQ